MNRSAGSTAERATPRLPPPRPADLLVIQGQQYRTDIAGQIRRRLRRLLADIAGRGLLAVARGGLGPLSVAAIVNIRRDGLIGPNTHVVFDARGGVGRDTGLHEIDGAPTRELLAALTDPAAASDGSAALFDPLRSFGATHLPVDRALRLETEAPGALRAHGPIFVYDDADTPSRFRVHGCILRIAHFIEEEKAGPAADRSARWLELLGDGRDAARLVGRPWQTAAATQETRRETRAAGDDPESSCAARRRLP